jgi:predicted branched-subunit amino acid permease
VNVPKESIFLGIKRFLPISPSVALFGMILGITGGIGGVPMILVLSSSFIIFAGSAQFIVILLIIEGEPLLALIIAGIIINLRHLLYGAALHHDISSTGLKKAVLAYLLTDEAFLITSLVKNELNEKNGSETDIHLDGVLFGAGFMLWAVWNISTFLGYLTTNIISSDVLNLLSPNFIVAATFLGYLISHWQQSSSDQPFILVMILTSIFLSFFLQSSTLLIVTMILGILFAMIEEYSRANRQTHPGKLNKQLGERK